MHSRSAQRQPPHGQPLQLWEAQTGTWPSRQGVIGEYAAVLCSVGAVVTGEVLDSGPTWLWHAEAASAQATSRFNTRGGVGAALAEADAVRPGLESRRGVRPH